MHRVSRLVGWLAATVTSAAVASAGLVAAGVPAAQANYAVPPTPTGFTSAIEDVEPYIGQTTCQPWAKPGVVDFEKLILRTYPDTGSDGITKSCSSPEQSEHKEGRAWDWAVSAYNTRQAGEANRLLAWLTAKDQWGHPYAMARRLGIMYIIWNHRMWRSYDNGSWLPYTGSNPHTDHVHFSFGWNGAWASTSYWHHGAVAPINFGPTPPPHANPVRAISNIALVHKYGGTTLVHNSSGTAVSIVQKGLHYSPIDGSYGYDTAAYVARLQTDFHLPVTLNFGKAEWKALFPAPINPFGALDAPATALGNLVVRGWTIDADSTGPVNISATVDGGAPTANVPATTYRSDVATSFPDYGPNHGFAVVLPADPTVSHVVCITAHNVTGTPGVDTKLGCQTVNPTHDPIGAITSATTTLGTTTVTGWALDPDAAGPLTSTLTVDGVTSSAAVSAISAPDIAATFPGAADNQGLTATLVLPDGTHTVCLVARNAPSTAGADATVGCRSVTVHHTPVGALSTLRRAPGGVLVAGWAGDQDSTSPSTVSITSDGAAVASTTANLTGQSFSTTVGLPVGAHKVCVTVLNTPGTPGTALSLPCGTVTISHNATGVLSRLFTVPGSYVAVNGDAYDPDTLAASVVTVTLDGRVVKTLQASHTSPTSAARWPGYGPYRAFQALFLPSTGTHTVCVNVLNTPGTPGTSTKLGCRTLVVHNTGGALTSMTVSRTSVVRGWAFDPDTQSPVLALVVVDGRAIRSAWAQAYRSDLVALLPGYGGYRGFSVSVPLAVGSHKVCVIARNVPGTLGASQYVGCRVVSVT